MTTHTSENVKITSDEKRQFFIDAVKNNSTKNLKLALKSSMGNSELYDWALERAAQDGFHQIVQLLLNSGVDPNATEKKHLKTKKAQREKKHLPALTRAVRDGHFQCVKILVAHGANIHCVQDQALRWASESGHHRIVKFLLESGADVHARNDNSLTQAAMRGNIQCVKLLIKHGANVNANDGYEADPLGQAAQCGTYETVKTLLDNGANMQTNNDYALWTATRFKRDPITELLLRRGADVVAFLNRGLLYHEKLKQTA